jgi:hypothetical protein
MRARTLRRMTEGAYLTAVKASSVRGWLRVEPVPPCRPEQPRRLLSFLDTNESRLAREHLPAHAVADIATATTAV